MKSFNISGIKREETGKSSAAQHRNEGYIPCELYGKSGNVHFAVHINDLNQVVMTPETYRVHLDVDGTTYQTIMKEVQFHPLSDQVTHADFFEIDESKPVKLKLPINFIGTAAGAREGGKFVKKLRALSVKGLAKDMPDAIDLDVTELGLGKSLKVRDIKVSGIEVINPGAIPVATVEVPRGLKGKTEEADTKKKK